MINSKIYSFLNALTQKEKNQIQSLLNADYFSLNDTEKNLLEALLQSPDLLNNKEALYLQFFESKTYNDQRLRLSISKIFKCLESFAVLSQIDLKSNQHTYNLFLSRYYRIKELNKLYQSVDRQFEVVPKQGGMIPLEIQLERAFEEYQYNSLRKRNQELNLQNLLDLTDLNFYARKLRYACYALSHGMIYNVDYQFKHLDQILEEIEANEYYNDARVGVYYYCYLMSNNPNSDEYYQNYKSFLYKNQRIFEFEEKRSLYFFALNHCIKKLNSGEKSFGKEGLDIYQNAIQNSTLLINGNLSRFTYRNVAMMAIRINDFDLADKLTNEYESLLRRTDRESAFHFNKALIYYYQKDLDLALENIMLADFNDHLINLAAKTLQAKIYFELREEQLLESHLDSVEMYLIRKKILGYHRKNYKNFIKYTKKLVKTNPYNKDKLNTLKTKISAEDVLTEKKWLLEQLA